MEIPPFYSRSLSRSDSMTSVESDGGDPPPARRTRKRFNSVQLMMLENLFHHNSHPSRQERETLAKAGQMEIKSVTIWFQNKRQTERRGAQNALNSTTTNNRGAKHTFHSNHSVPAPAPFPSITATMAHTRPSLDRVASLSELPEPPHEPRTPTRLIRTRSVASDSTVVDEETSTNANVSTTPSTFSDSGRTPIWESMPSSPPVPFTSPPARDFVEFGKLNRTRTLEWACARQRLAGKEGGSKARWDDEDVDLETMMNQDQRPLKRSKSHHGHSSSSRSKSSLSSSSKAKSKASSSSSKSGSASGKTSSSKHHHRHSISGSTSVSLSASASASAKHKSNSSKSRPRPKLYRSNSDGNRPDANDYNDDEDGANAKKAIERALLGNRRSASRASTSTSMSSPTLGSASVSGSSYTSASTSITASLWKAACEQERMMNMSDDSVQTLRAGAGSRMEASASEDDDVMRAALALCGLGRG
ncbi:hypothetical protein VKT23_006306 [Stygiomarasmius scandens]|uniref:Homeobox domain-containing protein n=1 Tax=Marasmiellus scandens TaxID=2682957 RepID=A0ABR1JS28_9AGAR